MTTPEIQKIINDCIAEVPSPQSEVLGHLIMARMIQTTFNPANTTSILNPMRRKSLNKLNDRICIDCGEHFLSKSLASKRCAPCKKEYNRKQNTEWARVYAARKKQKLLETEEAEKKRLAEMGTLAS
jgi:hypothetical protein